METVEKIRQHMADDLQPQEKVLYGTFGMRVGEVRKAMIGGALGIVGAVGAVAVAATTRRAATVPGTSIQLPKRFYFGLTNQRLLVFAAGGALVAKPKDLLHSYSYEQVAWITDELIPGVAKAYRVSIGIVDTGVLNLEFARLQVADARPMVSRVRSDMPKE